MTLKKICRKIGLLLLKTIILSHSRKLNVSDIFTNKIVNTNKRISSKRMYILKYTAIQVLKKYTLKIL